MASSVLAIAAASLATTAIVLGAALATGTRLRRGCAAAVTQLVWVAPWIAPAQWPCVRTLLVVAAVPTTMRAIDVARSDWPLARRLGHTLSFVDSRRVRAARARFDFCGFATWIAWLTLTALGLWVVWRATPAMGASPYWVMRWAGALVAAYAVSEGAYMGFVPAIYRAAGKEIPALHRAPGAARSLGEFWGSRWNLTISQWFRQNLFAPLVRAGRPRTGMALVFLASAAMHAYIVLAAVGPTMAGVMLAYFLVQGALTLLENALRVTRWSRPAARAWTIGLMTTTSPLFTEPFLRCVGFGASQ